MYLNRLTQVSNFYELMAARQKACSIKWGILDGHAGKRILQLLEETEKNYPLA